MLLLALVLSTGACASVGEKCVSGNFTWPGSEYWAKTSSEGAPRLALLCPVEKFTPDKVVVEKNALSLGMQQYGMSQSSLGAQMLRDGAGVDQISEALAKAAKGDMPEGQDVVKGLLTAWGEFFGVPVSALTSNETMTPTKAAEIIASGMPTSEAKLVQYVLAKAYLAVSENAGSIKNVNPGYPEPGRTHNCVNCSVATDATLAGNPASALPVNHQNGIPLTVLEKQYGNKFKYVSSSENIMQQMADAGSGSRGIVFGSYGPGQPGHVFNIVNQNGTIRFLDGQTGKPADLSQFKSFQLLRTN